MDLRRERGKEKYRLKCQPKKMKERKNIGTVMTREEPTNTDELRETKKRKMYTREINDNQREAGKKEH